VHLFYYCFRIPLCGFTSLTQRFDVANFINCNKLKLLEGSVVVKVKCMALEP
jgi:hypothetical protein